MLKMIFVFIVLSFLLFSCQVGIDTGEQSKETKQEINSDSIGKSVVRNINHGISAGFTCAYDYSEYDIYAIPYYLNIPQTYNYDDGQFRGALSLVRYGYNSKSYSDGWFTYDVGILYNGNVTLYPETKFTTSYTYTQYAAFNGEENNALSYVYIPPTYYYSDPYYHGTLNYSYYNITSITHIYGPIFQYNVMIAYDGYITSN